MSYSFLDLQNLWRADVQDVNTPTLWSADEFYAYLDDGLSMFYRLTEGIEDSRTLLDVPTTGTALTAISVVPNTEWYDISKKILKIRTATRSTDGRPVRVSFPEQLEELNIRFISTRKGPVDTIVQGLEKHALRIWPVPNETITLNLSVFRLPLVTPTVDVEDLFPEIDDQHALSILMWVKHRAYDKQDEDAYDKRRSLDFKERFEAYCTQAKSEQIRARHNTGAIAYGGLPINGSARPPRGSNDYYNR